MQPVRSAFSQTASDVKKPPVKQLSPVGGPAVDQWLHSRSRDPVEVQWVDLQWSRDPVGIQWLSPQISSSHLLGPPANDEAKLSLSQPIRGSTHTLCTHSCDLWSFFYGDFSNSFCCSWQFFHGYNVQCVDYIEGFTGRTWFHTCWFHVLRV